MPTYRKPLDLEALQAYLHGRGFKRSVLTVKEGAQQLEFGTVIVDQAGNVRVRDDSDAAANLAMEITKTIQMFRDE